VHQDAHTDLDTSFISCAAETSVLATWHIRSKKWQLGLSLPASFSLSAGTQPTKEQGNGSHRPEKTLGYGQQIIKEDMQRLYE
jgi:hypothetical protein